MRPVQEPLERPRGLWARFVFPAFAVSALGLGCYAVVGEFLQDYDRASRIKGYVLETTTMSKDAPATPFTVAQVAETKAEEPVVAQVEPVQAVRPAPAAAVRPASESAAVAAIKDMVPPVDKPVEPKAEAPQLAYAPPVVQEVRVVVGDGRLNVRSGPSRGHDKVHMLDVGAEVSVLERTDGWLRIRDEDGRIGWASAEYVLPPAEAEEIAAAAEAERRAADTMTVRSGVNVRSGPGRNHGKVFGLSAGDEVEVLDRKSGWINIATESGKKGWVYSSFLKD